MAHARNTRHHGQAQHCERANSHEKGELVVPLMNELSIPVAKPDAESISNLGLLARLHLDEQETKLLPEGVQALPPVAAAVLIHVADKDFVEELVNLHSS